MRWINQSLPKSDLLIPRPKLKIKSFPENGYHLSFGVTIERMDLQCSRFTGAMTYDILQELNANLKYNTVLITTPRIISSIFFNYYSIILIISLLDWKSWFKSSSNWMSWNVFSKWCSISMNLFESIICVDYFGLYVLIFQSF